jgi:hypothetical protein
VKENKESFENFVNILIFILEISKLISIWQTYVSCLSSMWLKNTCAVGMQSSSFRARWVFGCIMKLVLEKWFGKKDRWKKTQK